MGQCGSSHGGAEWHGIQGIPSTPCLYAGTQATLTHVSHGGTGQCGHGSRGTGCWKFSIHCTSLENVFKQEMPGLSLIKKTLQGDHRGESLSREFPGRLCLKKLTPPASAQEVSLSRKTWVFPTQRDVPPRTSLVLFLSRESLGFRCLKRWVQGSRRISSILSLYSGMCPVLLHTSLLGLLLAYVSTWVGMRWIQAWRQLAFCTQGVIPRRSWRGKGSINKETLDFSA